MNVSDDLWLANLKTFSDASQSGFELDTWLFNLISLRNSNIRTPVFVFFLDKFIAAL